MIYYQPDDSDGPGLLHVAIVAQRCVGIFCDRLGLAQRGIGGSHKSRIPSEHLSEELVVHIFESEIPTHKLAAKLDITASVIRQIRSGANYRRWTKGHTLGIKYRRLTQRKTLGIEL